MGTHVVLQAAVVAAINAFPQKQHVHCLMRIIGVDELLAHLYLAHMAELRRACFDALQLCTTRGAYLCHTKAFFEPLL